MSNTIIHDSQTCTEDNGQPCEFCIAADEYERKHLATDEAILSDVDEVLMSLSPFALAWATAPESQRRYTEYDLAQFWFRQGQIATNSATIEDLNAMESMMKARGLK